MAEDGNSFTFLITLFQDFRISFFENYGLHVYKTTES